MFLKLKQVVLMKENNVKSVFLAHHPHQQQQERTTDDIGNTFGGCEMTDLIKHCKTKKPKSSSRGNILPSSFNSNHAPPFASINEVIFLRLSKFL